jgi:glycosyltransferase involved in cell wall biosynthesis
MHIAILGSRGYPSTYSGYETFLRYFVPFAVEAGNSVTVYCRWREDGQTKWSTDGADCRATFGVDSKSLSTLSYGLSSSLDVRSLRPDAALIVNCANGLWLPLIRQRGVPTVFNVDGLEWERGKWNRVAKSLFLTGAKMAAQQADILVTDSVEIGHIWKAKFGVRTRFIPYGAPILTDRTSDAVTSLGLVPNSYGLTVGRVVPENNISMTLDAYEAMAPQERIPWVFVGSAVGRSALEDRLRALSQDPDFHWLGHISDQTMLNQLWSHCLVCVHGHSVGGTNPSLLQAMGAGAPVAAFDTPFNREVLTNEGMFYSDLPSLRTAIQAIIRSKSLRSRLSDLGRTRVRDQYTWSGVCEGYLALIDEARSDAALAPTTRPPKG